MIIKVVILMRAAGFRCPDMFRVKIYNTRWREQQLW